MNVSILKSTKLRGKFCTRMEKTFSCKSAFMCSVACPLWIAFHVECLMNDKNLQLGEAFRLTIRESIDEGTGRRIIKDIVENRDTSYPDRRNDGHK